MTMALIPLNTVTDWFNDLANSMIESMSNARVEIVKELAKTSLPTTEQLQNEWYTLGLGGTYGLATKLVILVVVALSLMMIVTPMKNHSVRMRRMTQSVVYVGLFGALFFPFYSFAHNLVMGAVQGMINIALGKEFSSLNEATTAMLEVLMPEDVWFRVFFSLLAMLFTYCAYAVALVNYIAILMTVMFYPLALALRPLGERFNSLFHAANSALVTTLVTPLVITFGLLLPSYSANMLPGLGVTGFGAGIFTILGALISFIGPLFVAKWAFKASKTALGTLDYGSIGGAVDVNSMPPVTSRDMDNSVKESGFKAFASSLVIGGATAQLGKSDNLLGDVKSLAVEAAAATAAATGHPVAAGVLNAVDTTLTKEKRAAAEKQAQSAPPHSETPVDSSWPPPTPPSNVVDHIEWPAHKSDQA